MGFGLNMRVVGSVWGDSQIPWYEVPALKAASCPKKREQESGHLHTMLIGQIPVLCRKQLCHSRKRCPVNAKIICLTAQRCVFCLLRFSLFGIKEKANQGMQSLVDLSGEIPLWNVPCWPLLIYEMLDI